MGAIKMGIGFGLWQQGMPDAATLFAYIDQAEAWGIDSVWLSDHMMGERAEVSIVPMMAAIAARTRRLKFGPSVMMLPLRHPIAVAKDIATLDFLSNGRFLFGIGGGWNAEEMANHGTDFRRRWKVLRERIEAMKVIWRDDNAEYHGEFVNFDPIWSWPKPVQKPHPPIYLGGHGDKALERVVRYCDGWMPIPVRAGALLDEIKTLRSRAAAAGRDPASLAVTLYGMPADADAVRETGRERLVLLPAVEHVIAHLRDVDPARAHALGHHRAGEVRHAHEADAP